MTRQLIPNGYRIAKERSRDYNTWGYVLYAQGYHEEWRVSANRGTVSTSWWYQWQVAWLDYYTRVKPNRFKHALFSSKPQWLIPFTWFFYLKAITKWTFNGKNYDERRARYAVDLILMQLNLLEMVLLIGFIRYLIN